MHHADDSIDCLVVSEETRKGGAIVNQERVKKVLMGKINVIKMMMVMRMMITIKKITIQGMSELEVDVLELVNDRVEDQGDELKVSSSKARKRLLGTLLKPPQVLHASMHPLFHVSNASFIHLITLSSAERRPGSNSLLDRPYRQHSKWQVFSMQKT